MRTNSEIDNLISELPDDAACFGYCVDCDEMHYLGEGNSRKYALELMECLEVAERIDFESEIADLKFATSCLQGPRGGQMFGVLECRDGAQNVVILKAFSGQFNGKWEAPGWVPPAFDIEKYYQLLPQIESKVHALTHEIEICNEEAKQAKISFEESIKVGQKSLLKVSRKQMQEALKNLDLAKDARRSYSQSMMFVVQDLYQLDNFKSEQRSILDVFYEKRGIPTGSGDCCAPKLLQFAASHNLTPIGLSEFYFGKTNKSKTRFHGEFYPSCLNKCQPILGYMLCGL